MAGPLRVGVIGAGAIAQVAHLPMLSRSTEFELVAIGDNDLSKARALAQRFDIAEVYDDIEYLLKHARPDVVAVCTPNHLHEVHVKTALAAGAHVLCERPLALGTGGVEAVMAAQERADRAVLVGMHDRFRSDVQAVRQFLAGGELGTVHAVRAEWYTFKPARQALGWRLQRAQSGGGAMLDLGIGLIDLALWLLDWPKPCQVFAHFGPPDRRDAVEDSGIALVSCEGGTSIAVDVTWRYVGHAERVRFEVLGSAGSGSIGPLAVFKELNGAAVNVTRTGLSEHASRFNAAYAAQWAHFAAMIQGDVERADLHQQVMLHNVMEGIYRSAQEGVLVQL
ncbi:MAG: Gfo/Idh/MocA family oxidoreductase [Gemmatimonadetes bacterium]|nr:Gfo/Idh/MocA family oxidoreductase [Gemmatimonadota bacterium]